MTENTVQQRDPRYNLIDAIRELNEHYYYYGDDSHRYAHCCITKELGDLLLNKYAEVFNNTGIYLRGIEHFDLSQTNIISQPLTFEEFWNEFLCYEDLFIKYENFEDFKKGEGFE